MDFSRRSFRIWVTATILVLTTCAMTSAQLYNSRQRHLESGHELALALSNAAAQRLAANLSSIDALLQEAAARFPSTGTIPPNVLEPLRQRVLAIRDLRALSFVDPDGILRQVVHRKGPEISRNKTANVSDRPHVQFQRRNWQEKTLALSPPALDRLTETMAWFASRPVVAEDGSLLGLVAVVMEPSLLEAPLMAAPPQDGDAAGVFSTDGILYARIPDQPQAIGRPMTESEVFKAFKTLGAKGGITDLTSITDQQQRSVGFTPVPGYPLVVNVGISHHRLLAQWWHEARIHGGILAALTITIFVLAWGMARAERRQLAAVDKLRQVERAHIEELSQQVIQRTDELQKSLEALSESEERFRLIADTSPLPLVVTRRKDGIVIYINAQAAEAFQVPMEEGKGKVAPNFWENPADRTRMVETLAREGYVRDLEAVLLRSDGKRFTALLSGAFGTLQGEGIVLISVLDISDRKRLQEELARSNSELERFSYAISHDLQEPLRMVASYVGLIERRYADKLDDQGREFMAFAVDGAKRMSRMINELLEYSRVKRQTWNFSDTDLNKVMADALANLDSRIKESGAQVDVAPLPTLPADAGQIMRVLQNLVGNALKYRSPQRPPHIRVEARQDGDSWVIEIRDNGLGFEPDEASRLFQVFQRLHAAKGIDGTGIGLALCRSIVAAHDGTITAHSDGPEQGAVFILTLPIRQDTKKGAD
ncbi:MAG: PAS domain S-box protein [Magnetospirillum gryphiswaldense]|nr:PAS domain S-box protein [Magnetospirillum gryphiswaldense]